jgi:hypothetical protein
VSEAEAEIHHVLLSEGTGFPQGAHVASEDSAEAWKICGHPSAKLEAPGCSDHGSKCRSG